MTGSKLHRDVNQDLSKQTVNTPCDFEIGSRLKNNKHVQAPFAPRTPWNTNCTVLRRVLRITRQTASQQPKHPASNTNKQQASEKASQPANQQPATQPTSQRPRQQTTQPACLHAGLTKKHEARKTTKNTERGRANPGGLTERTVRCDRKT